MGGQGLNHCLLVLRTVVGMEDHSNLGKMGVGQNELESRGGGLTQMMAGAGMGKNDGE